MMPITIDVENCPATKDSLAQLERALTTPHPPLSKFARKVIEAVREDRLMAEDVASHFEISRLFDTLDTVPIIVVPLFSEILDLMRRPNQTQIFLERAVNEILCAPPENQSTTPTEIDELGFMQGEASLQVGDAKVEGSIAIDSRQADREGHKAITEFIHHLAQLKNDGELCTRLVGDAQHILRLRSFIDLADSTPG
jgi:hypothetical protein